MCSWPWRIRGFDLSEGVWTVKEKPDFADHKSLTPRQRAWRRFLSNRLTLVGLIILLIFYVSFVIFPEFVAPYGLTERHRGFSYAPPQLPRFVDDEGQFHLRPFVYRMTSEINPATFQTEWTYDTEEKYPIRFLVSGSDYKLWGLFPANVRLFGVEEGQLFLFGTDNQGRDMLSRMIYASRISLSVGLVGVFLSIVLGAVLGTISGYYGGMVDNVIQRIIETLMAFPQIPLWMALAAAVPPEFSPIAIYFAITVILSLVTWGGLARGVRSKVLSYRENEYTQAAHAMGAKDRHIIFVHLLPNAMSHILVMATLAIPNMIIGETMLSFLGIGIRPPMTSWGVLMEEAQNVRVLLEHPWVVIPVSFVILSILAFNFIGDGLRDAADPYS